MLEKKENEKIKKIKLISLIILIVCGGFLLKVIDNKILAYNNLKLSEKKLESEITKEDNDKITLDSNEIKSEQDEKESEQDEKESEEGGKESEEDVKENEVELTENENEIENENENETEVEENEVESNEQEINDKDNNKHKEESKPIKDKKNSYYQLLQKNKYADDAKSVQRMLVKWNFEREDNKKVAYLTFDDGPSTYVTNKILDILKNNDVKATFFVLGNKIEESETSKETVKRIIKEGHGIGNHSFTHSYEILYPDRIANREGFMGEIHAAEKAMKNVLGEDFETKVIRLPGGHMSWNTENIDPVLKKEGYAYIDWNVLNGDAEGLNIGPDQLMERLKRTVGDLAGNDDTLVVLMHDTDQKETTAQYLQDAINYLKNLGYEFRVLK